jgi:hypothetical protein
VLFAVCADRGAPGSTTTALALAAARGLPAVVVETDPYGGDLALRLRPDGKHPLPERMTVLGIGAGRSARRPAQSGPVGLPDRETRHLDLWRDGSHQLTPLVRVVPGFFNAEQGTSLAWPVLAAALQAQTVLVCADLGRIHTGSPSMPVAAAADALITVCRGDMASVHHMVDRLELLVTTIAEQNGRPPAVLPVVIAGRRQSGDRLAAAVAEILGDTKVAPALRGVGWLAWDGEAVARLEDGGDPWASPLRKSRLMRSARQVMWHLGMATGIDHAQPEVTGNRAAGKKARAAGEQATALTPPARTQHPATSPPPHPPPPQGPPPSSSAWVGPPAAGRPVNGQHAATGDAVSLDEQGPRWQRPMGEER